MVSFTFLSLSFPYLTLLWEFLLCLSITLYSVSPPLAETPLPRFLRFTPISVATQIIDHILKV